MMYTTSLFWVCLVIWKKIKPEPLDVGAEDVIDVPENEGEDVKERSEDVEFEACVGVLDVGQVEVHEQHRDHHDAVECLQIKMLEDLKSIFNFKAPVFGFCTNN